MKKYTVLDIFLNLIRIRGVPVGYRFSSICIFDVTVFYRFGPPYKPNPHLIYEEGDSVCIGTINIQSDDMITTNCGLKVKRFEFMSLLFGNSELKLILYQQKHMVSLIALILVRNVLTRHVFLPFVTCPFLHSILNLLVHDNPLL